MTQKVWTWCELKAFSQLHPYLCACGECDGFGDPISAFAVLGVFHEQADGTLKELCEKDKS